MILAMEDQARTIILRGEATNFTASTIKEEEGGTCDFLIDITIR